MSDEMIPRKKITIPGDDPNEVFPSFEDDWEYDESAQACGCEFGGSCSNPSNCAGIDAVEENEKELKFPRVVAMALADVFANGTEDGIVQSLADFCHERRNEKKYMTKGTATLYAAKLHNWILEQDSTCPFNIFAKGNMKLPFWMFSTLAIVTCPGAGACKDWCYSLKAWRNPSAFFNHACSTFLMRFRKDLIAEAFYELGDGQVLRLYCNGDFDSAGTLDFWMELLESRPPFFGEGDILVAGIQAYTYSKSWDLIMSYNKRHRGRWPEGFYVNISGGSKWDGNKKKYNDMLELSCTRGEFIAVELPSQPRGSRSMTDAEKLAFKERAAKAKRLMLAKSLREIYGTSQRWYPCPGKCGVCVKVRDSSPVEYTHACGSPDFKDVIIGIGLH